MKTMVCAALACAWFLAGGAGLAADKPRFGTFGLDLAAGDPKVAAGDDFNRHVNGHWIDTTPIPPDWPWWGPGGELVELSTAHVHDILEEATQHPSSPDARKFGDFYASYMDEAAIEAKGAQPLAAELAVVDAAKTPQDLARLFAHVERTAPLFGFGGGESDFPVSVDVDVDLKAPTRYLASVGQGGLGLPDRDYYAGDDKALADARAAYKSYMATMFGLAGLADGPARADRVMALEAQFAATHWKRADLRDVTKTYNLMTPAELEAQAPGFDWATYLQAIGFGGEAHLRVYSPSAMTGFAKLVPATPMETWRDYVRLRVIGNAAPYLSKAFVDAEFAYTEKALAGTPQMRVRWKRGARYANRALGDAIGRVYAERYFPAASKAAMLTLIPELKLAMAGRIERLAWMSPATKVRAKRKLANLRIEVGYPDRWRDYAALTVVRGDPAGNARRAAAFEFDRNIAHLGKPVDRSEWWASCTPQTVNAFNAGPLVKLVFPAAFLGPPVFDPAADPAVNYGAIGAVIGHEISHSFDDQGAKLDETGALNSWWTPADEAAFKTATDALAKQYDGYEPLPGLHVNGRLTLGENTADLAGLAVALDAYHASLGGKPAPVLGGLTGDQRFFAAYAQVWRSRQRDEDLRSQVTTDPHSPDPYRVMTLRNIDAWYAAYDVRPGQAMALPPPARVRIW